MIGNNLSNSSYAKCVITQEPKTVLTLNWYHRLNKRNMTMGIKCDNEVYDTTFIFSVLTDNAPRDRDLVEYYVL